MSQGKVNVYVCPKCKGKTVTIDAVDGTTPFMIKCSSVGGCHEEMAKSSFYRVDQNLVPTHEWYRPEGEELDKLKGETREHVDNGGLLLRRIDGELLPCPFCGSRNVKMSGPGHWSYEDRNAAAVVCDDCEAMGPVEVDPESREPVQKMAAASWNRRHSPLETPT